MIMIGKSKLSKKTIMRSQNNVISSNPNYYQEQ